jgi:hypothetical protein
MSVQPGLRGSSDLRVGRKMATFQLVFQSGQAKDLSAPLYVSLHEEGEGGMGCGPVIQQTMEWLN